MNRFFSAGIPLKKKHGQYFLRQQSIVDHMLDAVELNITTSVFEIGCGDGFLTRSILQKDIERFWVFEIDSDWAAYVKKELPDQRLSIFEQDILQINFDVFEAHQPWVLLSNLPYQITFPILHLLQQNRHLLREGVVMMQEEVAQKIMKTTGRGYGFSSLFFQRFFQWEMLDKVPPSAFYPQPKIFSRLMYFKPRPELEPIEQEERFWKFIKVCFHQPRRMLRNNLAQSGYNLSGFSEKILLLRAQQLTMPELHDLWCQVLAKEQGG